MNLPTFSSISGMNVCVGETGPFCNTSDAVKLRAENAKLRKLVVAVTCREFSGIKCLDVDGKNWFDLRDTISPTGCEAEGKPLTRESAKKPACGCYNYDEKGRTVLVLKEAHTALIRRGWARGVNQDYAGQLGTVDFEYGRGAGDHHYAVIMPDGNQVGFPPETVRFI